VHGDELTEFLELQAWPYGTILWLEATNSPDRFHLRARTLEEPLAIGSVEYFDINEDGEPVLRTSHPEPFSMSIDERVYRQERRWENRQAYDVLVAQKGDGVLTAVFEALEAAAGPMSAAAIHRLLMRNGRPCSYFSVLAVLYGYKCFEVTDGHNWKVAGGGPTGLREGYQTLLGMAEGAKKRASGDRERPEDACDPSPLTAEDLDRLTRDLRVLARPYSKRWIEAIDRLVGELVRIRHSLMERV
jgi:hypothetical protein